jgi:metallophosphoesterase (TIGR03767 family)
MQHLTTQVSLPFERTTAANGFTRTHLTKVAGEPVKGDAPEKVQPLATFIHLSDLHICDAKSPARIEFLDRYADPDYETRAFIDYVGSYRPQEFLTLQVLEAMVQASNSIQVGPLLGAGIDGVLITGDVIDNGQANELEWYKTLLEGGQVSSASGDPSVVEAAHGTHPNFTDPHYYKPDSSDGSRTDELFGMVQVPGLAMAAQQPFEATGLSHQWFAIHGNHDAMLQGMVAPNPELNGIATGDQKLSGVVEGVTLPQIFEEYQELGPAGYPKLDYMTTTKVTPDANRHFIQIEDWVETHLECGHDHGIGAEQKTAYWTKDFGQIRVIALDSVNPHSGWQGCIDRVQLEWFQNLMAESADKYVVLTSHHPLEDFINDYAPEGFDKPAIRDEFTAVLDQYPNIVLWVAGHVHDHSIKFNKSAAGDYGFWQIRTGSHMDWPQQSRVIEIGKTTDGRIAIGTVVFNHAGAQILELPELAETTDAQLADPVYLAGISRILSVNDWQRFDGSNKLEVLEGQPEDRNAWLWLADPLV